MTRMKKWVALSLLLAVCSGTLCACIQLTETTAAVPMETESIYAQIVTADLLPMLLECECDVMEKLFWSQTTRKSVTGMMTATQDCDLMEEYLSRPDAVSAMREHGRKVYSTYVSGDHNTFAAAGFEILFCILCPDLTSRS